MAQQNPRSLKHEYELYVENEIENYKESVSRSAILKIGDEAAASLRAGEQFAMDELLLWAEVDRIIRKRLRIPSYSTWRRKRVRMLEEYRRPEHWGIRPDGVLAREVHPPAESKVLVAGGDIDRTALYLAAHGCDVTAVDREMQPLERVMNAAHEAGLADRIQSYVAEITDWSPDVQLGALVCTRKLSTAYPWKSAGGRSSSCRARHAMVEFTWSGRSSEASAGLLLASFAGRQGAGPSPSNQIRSSKTFLAKKIAS
jgi:hypothetical protein